MANKNQNGGGNYNANREQPEGWFDPERYRQNQEQRQEQNRSSGNDQNRSRYQQTTNPNLVNRYDDLSRRRMQTQYPDQGSFNRQYGNANNQYGNRGNMNRQGSNNDLDRNREERRSSMYGDNFEMPARLRNDGSYRPHSDNHSGRYESGYNNYNDRNMLNNRDNDEYNDRNNDERDWWDKASDEVASWFGNDEAERRRRMDKLNGPHSGKGPKGYTRTDARLQEDINERLYHDSFIDASDIDIKVENGEAILTGTVESREAKRRVEDIIESIPGVRDVENKLKVTSSNPSSSEYGSNRGDLSDGSSWNKSSV